MAKPEKLLYPRAGYALRGRTNRVDGRKRLCQSQSNRIGTLNYSGHLLAIAQQNQG